MASRSDVEFLYWLMLDPDDAGVDPPIPRSNYFNGHSSVLASRGFDFYIAMLERERPDLVMWARAAMTNAALVRGPGRKAWWEG